MKNSLFFICFLFSLIFVIGCGDTNKSNEGESIYGNEISLQPLVNSILEMPDTVFLKTANKSFRGFSDEIPTSRDQLYYTKVLVKTFKGDKNAGMTVPGFGGLTLGAKESSLHVYYVEAVPVKIGSDTIVYGVGYSIDYLFKKVKKGIDISNLAQVAASAQLQSEKTSVLYCSTAIGVRSYNLYRFFKPQVSANYDVNGFGVIQSNIDGMHAIFSDSLLSMKARFKPEPLPFIKAKDLLSGQ